MNYNVLSGEIQAGRLYYVVGASVIYNSVTYTTDQSFRGVLAIITFTYTGTGTQALYEVLELVAGGIEYVENAEDQDFPAETTKIKGFAIEFDLNEAEKIVQETTKIEGFAIGFIDYPFYSFAITETRL